jgi:hypothetical protein
MDSIKADEMTASNRRLRADERFYLLFVFFAGT